MKCPKCEADNQSESKFCSECGTQLTLADTDKRPASPPEEMPFQTKTLETSKDELTTGSTFAGRY